MESPLRRQIPNGTRLIETFGWWPEEGARHASLHLERLAAGAKALGYPFDPLAADQAMAATYASPRRCRLTLDADGQIEVTTAAMAPLPKIWTVQIAAEALRANDPWLGLKTTNRAVYDDARAQMPQGIDELLFCNERGELCEGTVTNIFVETASGARVTPRLSSGLLPGVLRQQLLTQGWAEAVVRPDDLRLAAKFWVGNSLRGLIPAQLLQA